MTGKATLVEPDEVVVWKYQPNAKDWRDLSSREDAVRYWFGCLAFDRGDGLAKISFDAKSRVEPNIVYVPRDLLEDPDTIPDCIGDAIKQQLDTRKRYHTCGKMV